MTRPRLEVAEVIRSCRDAFLRTVRCGPDARATPRPRRPDRLPHRGPGWARPGVPGVRASGDRLQLVRQSPLPQVPGHGRRAMAGGPGRRPARHTVLPRRVHAPRRPRPDRLAQPPRGLRPAHAGRRGDPARGGRRTRAPRGRSRRAGGAAHLGPEPPAAPARPLRRHRRRALARREPLGRRPRRLLPAGPRPQPRVPGQVPQPGSAPPSSGGGSASRATRRRWRGRIEFQRLLAEAVRTEWVVYAKPPFGAGPRRC